MIRRYTCASPQQSCDGCLSRPSPQVKTPSSSQELQSDSVSAPQSSESEPILYDSCGRAAAAHHSGGATRRWQTAFSAAVGPFLCPIAPPPARQGEAPDSRARKVFRGSLRSGATGTRASKSSSKFAVKIFATLALVCCRGVVQPLPRPCGASGGLGGVGGGLGGSVWSIFGALCPAAA